MTRNIFLLVLCLSLYSCGVSQNTTTGQPIREDTIDEEEDYPDVEVDSEAFASYFIGEKIIIPEGVSGYFYIVYDSQPNDSDDDCCATCEGDYNNNLISNIPKSGIYRYGCDSRIHQEMLMNNQLQFFKGIYRDIYFSKKEPMNGYQLKEYLTIKSSIEWGVKKIDFKYPLDAQVVAPLGFKEEYRELVETQLGKPIIGKVACFRVGMVKEIFELNKGNK